MMRCFYFREDCYGLISKSIFTWIEKILKAADFITVNGNFLLQYVKIFNEKSAIIPDPIDLKLFSNMPKRKQSITTIGWEGNGHVHYENLSLLVKPLEKIAERHDFRFKMVSYLGDLRIKQMFNKLERKAEVDYGPANWQPANDFITSISDFEIMVSPLQKTFWCEGKSALRVGLGMALGIPVVASPIGEQKYIIQNSVSGFFAQDEDAWSNYLEMLLNDENLTETMGARGKEIAEESCPSKHQARNFLILLRQSGMRLKNLRQLSPRTSTLFSGVLFQFLKLLEH